MEKKLSKKTLTKSFHNWYYGNLTCFSQEHMQTFGYLCSMLPVVEELYDKKEDQARSMKTYTAFFNTEPQLGTEVHLLELSCTSLYGTYLLTLE